MAERSFRRDSTEEASNSKRMVVAEEVSNSKRIVIPDEQQQVSNSRRIVITSPKAEDVLNSKRVAATPKAAVEAQKSNKKRVAITGVCPENVDLTEQFPRKFFLVWDHCCMWSNFFFNRSHSTKNSC